MPRQITEYSAAGDYGALHRHFGVNAPMTDVDLLCVEFDRLQPVALIDLKSEGCRLTLDAPNIKALVNLANRASICAFVVQHAHSFAWWRLYDLNERAGQWLETHHYPVDTDLSLEAYIGWLYTLRGRPMPASVAEECRAVIAEGLARRQQRALTHQSRPGAPYPVVPGLFEKDKAA